jgi:DNA-binding NtrC family response regulator
MEAMAAMQAYEWPGNVRQLRNVVERTVILAPRERLGRIEPDMLPGEIVTGRMQGDGGMSALMGVPCARRARISSANICASRSGVFPATFPRRPALSAWNAQPCTAN